MRSENAQTKYRQFSGKYPRLKLISYDIEETWSVDVAYVNKLAKYIHTVKSSTLASDVLSLKLKVELMGPKSIEETAKLFARMIKMTKPQKVSSDEETELKGEFERFCENTNIATYSTHREANSSLSRRKYLVLEKQDLQTNGEQGFASLRERFAIICTKCQLSCQQNDWLAPNKISQRHVPKIISLQSEQSRRLARKA